MKNNFKYRIIYLLAFITLMLLISSCGTARKVEKTTKTTIIEWDSTIVSPRIKSTFRSSVPCCEGDSIILTDRKTGVQLKIKEFVSLEDILTVNTEPVMRKHGKKPRRNLFKPKLIQEPIPKEVAKIEYEFEIIHPEKEIQITIDKTVVEETKTIEKEIPWYYKLSLKFVIWLVAIAIILFLLKRVSPW